MPEKYGLSAWVSVSVAVVLDGFVVLGTYLMKTQHQLEEAEIVLSRAKEETVRAKARAADLAKVIEALRTELKAANTARNELQGKLDKANAAIAGLSETLDTAQSNLGNKQSQLQAIKGHCQSKFVYFAKTSEPDFAAIDYPAFFRVDLSGSMAARSIWNFALTTPRGLL